MNFDAIKIFFEAYGDWILLSSILLNIVLIRGFVVQKYRYALEKLKIKLAFIELEFKKDENERIIFLQNELKDVKEKLEQAKSEKRGIIILIIAVLLLTWVVTTFRKIKSPFKKENINGGTLELPELPNNNLNEFVQETAIDSNNSPEKLLLQVSELEKIEKSKVNS